MHKTVTPKYYKTEFGAIFGIIYMFTSMESSCLGLSNDVLIIMLNVVVCELLAISSIDECIEFKIHAIENSHWLYKISIIILACQFCLFVTFVK